LLFTLIKVYIFLTIYIWSRFAVKVECGESIMTVILTTAEPFVGRMYASGYGDVTICSINGVGKNVTILKLPLPKKEQIDKSNIACGLTPAFSIDNENRYLLAKFSN